MSKEYDEATKHQAVSDMKKVAALGADVRNLKKLDSIILQEHGKQIRYEINEKSMCRQ